MWQQLLSGLQQRDIKSLARSISFVENEVPGYEQLMKLLESDHSSKLIGITGPPGAGKSTLVDSMIGEFVKAGRRVGVICVDPSSPFNFGALLGDRIRMSEWYHHPDVFIRSLATRGTLGGLHPKIIEISDLLKEAGFDYILIETVGVGQTEVEIAGLADLTLVVLVPEGGDEIQAMKAGVMEIADIFVVNKSDRPGADQFVKNLHLMISSPGKKDHLQVPVIKTTATQKNSTVELIRTIEKSFMEKHRKKKFGLLAEQAYHLIQNRRMKDIDRNKLSGLIEQSTKEGTFNLYQFVEQFGD